MRRLLLRLYPRAWRQRYGEEIMAMLEQQPLRPSEVIDLLRGAVDARRNRASRPWEGVATSSAASPGRHRRARRKGQAMRRGKVGGYRCSFCGKGSDQVRRLIAGPQGVYICDGCIALCNSILADEEGRPPRAAAGTETTGPVPRTGTRSPWRRVLDSLPHLRRSQQRTWQGRLPL